MDATTSIKPKTMAELLPDLSSILTKGSIQTLTAKKQPRKTIAQTLTTEKCLKPLTIAEMRADLISLKAHSPRRYNQGTTSNRKKNNWNSSIKVDYKTVSHTANGKLINNSVRKVLNFQSKPKVVSNARATMTKESPKFIKPQIKRDKKPALLPANNNIRISGIHQISQTPVTNIPNKSRMTLANKENISTQKYIRKTIPTKFFKPKKVVDIPDTPMSNESWKSSCDNSFLQREKEINDIEQTNKKLTEENSLKTMGQVTPQIRQGFEQYRSVEEFFRHSIDVDSSALSYDNTIMSFEDGPDYKDNKREETVIVSLCDLLKKASVTQKIDTPKCTQSTELDDLLQIEKRTVNNIVTIENSIAALYTLKESQLTSLQDVRKMIKAKKDNSGEGQTVRSKETPVIEISTSSPKKCTVSSEKEEPVLMKTPVRVSSPIDKVTTPEEMKSKSSSPISVIKCAVKSPTYKIPKKNLCLRKKVFHKSMPNVSYDTDTTVKSDMGNRAFSMYMKMKEHMNFLSTPISKHSVNVSNTPAATSHNLQKQLDKLYN